jgi:Na+/glutamate symporter
MLFTLGVIVGTIVGFIVATVLSSKPSKRTVPIRIESSTEDDIRTIRRLKEIEFWQNFGNDK